MSRPLKFLSGVGRVAIKGRRAAILHAMAGPPRLPPPPTATLGCSPHPASATSPSPHTASSLLDRLALVPPCPTLPRPGPDAGQPSPPLAPVTSAPPLANLLRTRRWPTSPGLDAGQPPLQISPTPGAGHHRPKPSQYPAPLTPANLP